MMLGSSHMGDRMMTRFVGLDVSQKLTLICVVDRTGRRLMLVAKSAAGSLPAL